jgi:hypothetical protein
LASAFTGYVNREFADAIIAGSRPVGEAMA